MNQNDDKTESINRPEASYDAVKALLFYERIDRGAGGNTFQRDPFDIRRSFQLRPPETYISMHQIVDGVIGAGRSLSREEVINVCHTFLPQTVQTMFLPEKVIAVSPGVDMIWWVPAERRKLYFKKSSIFKTGEFPLPSLLFRATDNKLGVWAMKVDSRPDLDTELFYPPFPNMLYPGSTVCTGNTRLPKSVTVDRIKEWEKVFFKSYFTGTDEVQIRVQGTSWKKLWTELCAGRHKRFPVEHMVKFGSLRKLFDKGGV